MRFPVNLETRHLHSVLSDFLAITGWEAWEERRLELAQQLRENFLLADLFKERHRLELALFRLLDERRRRSSPPKQIRDPLEYQVAAFMATTVGFYRRLEPAGQTRLAGRLRDGLQSDKALAAIYLEMTTAAHFLQQGFDVDPSDLRRGGGFDFLIANTQIEAEVECKLATSDIGRRVHRRDMLALGHAVQPRLLQLRQNLDGGYFLNILLARRLTSNLAQHRQIADAIETALRDRKNVTTADFQVTLQLFGLSSTPFGEKDRTSIEPDTLREFILKRFGIPNAHAMAHGTPNRLAIIISVGSQQRDKVADGIYHQLRDATVKQFTRQRPAVLVARLADLSDQQLMSLVANQGREPNALQGIASRLLASEDRGFLDTVAFLGSGSVTRRTFRQTNVRTTVVGESGPCYVFRGPNADRRINFFRAE